MEKVPKTRQELAQERIEKEEREIDTWYSNIRAMKSSFQKVEHLENQIKNRNYIIYTLLVFLGITLHKIISS